MKRWPRSALLLAPGLVLFLLTLLWPIAALSARSFSAGTTPEAVHLVEVRLWLLFGKSLLLSLIAAASAIMLAIPAVFVVGRLGRLSAAPALGGMLLAPLLLPPMVYAFGWQRAGLDAWPPVVGVVWVWTCWCWPIPAMLIGAAWAKSGRAAYEAALLVTSPLRAFVGAVLPTLARPVLVAAAILMVLFTGEYSVPHAWGVPVLATELLGWAAQSANPADVLWPAMPLIAFTWPALGLVVWLGKRHLLAPPEETDAPPPIQPRFAVIVPALLALTVAVPLGNLIVRIGGWHLMDDALAVYRRELFASLGTAVLAGVIAVLMGLSLNISLRVRRVAMPVALLVGVLPGALIGQAVLTAYQPVWFIYNYWPLMLIGYVARYAWIGLLAAWLVESLSGHHIVDQARTDGANEPQIWLRLRYAPNIALLLCAAGVVTGMALSDVAVGTLLVVPGIGPISAILLEKFHRLEDGMLVALSLWMVVAALPAAVLAWLTLRLQSRGVSH
ncbi:MAG: hypothetical protein ACE5GE_00940 [Phycisphaerae bacterium]